MEAPGELMRLAAGQDGLVTRRQALAHGMSPQQIRHALGRGGRWQRLAAGVYATFTGPLSPRHRIQAALLYAGAGAMVTGGQACRAYGLRYAPHHDPLTVLVPWSARPARLPFAQMRRTRSPPDPRLLAGFPVAPPERSVLDACAGARSLRTVRALLCEAVQVGLTTPERLSAELAGGRWNGAGLARRAIEDIHAGCRSAPECELRDLVRSSLLLDEPRWNRPLPDVTGPPLIPDACWPDARVVVEIDSAEWHRLGDRVEQTERRRARYAALGWVVLPVSPGRLRDEAAAVLAEIEAAVLAARQRGAE
ncbi:type IV toxin-antitoxin system AbiEi family antitoxin domain-containing protein [Jiangella muralis]|uniref:type IV toxin-antitoxin system AbiEi family antitoxin domain-containing protein n=1 Tax=Jiangella muralis TaxID=702383 RepID=UPI00069F71E7|nr:type IV toxin-antitoxin system AbiEi family antitoxin domain-containing protein [Jiangella muralis]